MLLIVVEILVIITILGFLATQVWAPILKGQSLFPAFRHDKTKILQKELVEAQQKIEEFELEKKLREQKEKLLNAQLASFGVNPTEEDSVVTSNRKEKQSGY